MLSIQEPELRWGIAGWQTKLTGLLFTEEFFTFRKDADAYIEKTKARYADEGQPMINADDIFPVLLKVNTSICSDDETSAYDAEQAAWLEQHGQAAKRRREQQAKDGEGAGAL